MIFILVSFRIIRPTFFINVFNNDPFYEVSSRSDGHYLEFAQITFCGQPSHHLDRQTDRQTEQHENNNIFLVPRKKVWGNIMMFL